MTSHTGNMMTQSYKEQDDGHTWERNLLLEGKIKNLEILNCTFKEANNELSENVETLESERESLIVIKNDISNQVNVLKENNLIFQASNKNLLTQINEANDKVIKLTIGAKKVDKMLNMGKVHGDKTGFGYGCSSLCVLTPLTTFVKESNTKFDVLEPTRTQRFIPTCHHCGVKGHIRPRCNALRNVSRATNANGFKNHKVNDDSLQTQVNDLLYKVVKIPKVISLPHKVSKVKQVWIKKEDHDRNHHVNIDDFAASTEMALDEDGLLSSILEGESPGLDLVVDLSTFSKLVDQSTLDNSVPVDLSTCHNQPQNLSSSVLLKTLYRSKIGSLLYLTASRPDISYNVGFCARFQSDPKESHLFVVKRIIKYVSRTFEFGLLYTYDTCVNLVGYSDADWAGCSDGRKSTSGRVFYSMLQLGVAALNSFDETNVKLYLLAKDAWDVVEAATEPPTPEDGEAEFSAWRKNNAKALLAIRTAITTAKAAWDVLAEELKPSDSEEIKPFDSEELKPSDSEEFSFSSRPCSQNTEIGHNNNDDESDVKCAPLYDSLKRGDWNAAKEFIDRHEEALTHRGSSSGGTALHEEALHNVEELLKLMTEEDLEIQDDNGMAPIVAKMVKKNKSLVTMRFTNVAGNKTPVLVAYALGHWEIARFLYSRTPIHVLTQDNNGRDGAQLISNCFVHRNKFGQSNETEKK
ncbi:Ankyrin repeat family protein [Prunus dulcis]|uniref:Ankyrin repeat family protein n=1 Tax=Prunus dulcis TaxID=3755 RepID=A0A4Y1QKQ7_PRUDU|nr:Ankyrin repeat family protein [Prunus dulcis]